MTRVAALAVLVATSAAINAAAVGLRSDEDGITGIVLLERMGNGGRSSGSRCFWQS
jgi:hypothetical protein